MKKLVILALLATLTLCVSAQAAIYFEDFEGGAASGNANDDLGWTNHEPAQIGYGPTALMGPAGNTVLLQPAGNSIQHAPAFVNPGGNLLIVSADIFAVDLYNTAGGESGIGLDSAGSWTNPVLFGPGSNPTTPGYPGAGSGGWVVNDALTGAGRITVTDGGAPGVGNRFMGGEAQALTVQITFNAIADTISYDILDRATQVAINPTFVTPLGSADFSVLNEFTITHFDVHTPALAEIDNLTVAVPEPATMLLLGLGGLMLRKRRSA